MLVGFHLVSQPAGALEGYGWCLGPLCLVTRSSSHPAIFSQLTFSIKVALVCAANAVWNIYFHQLSGFQGPKLLTMSNIGLSILQLRGTSHHTLKKAHERYGSIVRISPSTLSFIDPEAWNDIYGYRNGRAVLPKDPQFYNEMVLDKNTITMASDNDAVPIRKAMNTAFSHRALLQQEPMLKIHIRRLMDQLSKASNSDNSNGQMSVDLRKWMVFSVFDINSDFAFGEDMGCVASGSLHEWVQFVVDYFYAATLLHQCYKFPPLNRLLAFCIPRSIREQHRRHNQASLLRVRQRIEMEKRRSQDSRPDFMHHFLRSARKEELSMPTIEAQASVVILAGSETSSVALVGALFYTLTHLHVYRKLCEEIRTAFPKPEDITLQDVLGLTYLDAVIQESLRLHTPLANGFTRVVVDKEGTMICGRWVPRGVSF